MYTLKSILAFITFAVGTIGLVWRVVLTQLPWVPANQYQAAAVLGTIFGMSMACFGSASILMRSGRAEVVIDDSQRWRWTEHVLLSEGFVCSLCLLFQQIRQMLYSLV